MDIVVFGAGSLGSLLGGLLSTCHDVTLVGRNPHIETIQTEGLQITGLQNYRRYPVATTAVPASTELVVVTVKAYDTAGTAKELKTVDMDAVLSVQNGMGNEAQLAEELSAPVLAGTCSYGARQSGPGVVEYTGEGEIVVGDHRGGTSPLAKRVGAAFTNANMNVTVAADMPRRLWEKLAVNAGINGPTALSGVSNGALLQGDGANIALSAASEVASVAQASNIELSEEQAMTAVTDVAAATAANMSSMHQDVISTSRTEVDSIYGFVETKAAATGVDVPIIKTLGGLIRMWELEQGLREDQS